MTRGLARPSNRWCVGHRAACRTCGRVRAVALDRLWLPEFVDCGM